MIIEWTQQEINELITMWNRGDKVVAIGKAMKKSKNAIVGKSHRLVAQGRLEARPNPVRAIADRTTAEPVEKRRKAIVGATLPPLVPTVAPVIAAPAPGVVAPKPAAKAAVVAARPAAVAPVAAPLIALPPTIVFKPRSAKACCWPFGTPGTKAFRFCDGTAEPARPYCAKHCARAYVRRAPAEVAA